MSSYQFHLFNDLFIHLWVKVSRLGGANRKGFNGGVSEIDTETVSISVSLWIKNP